MALEMNDLLALKSMGEGMSPYETFKVGHMQSKRPSGAATAGLVLGSVGTALAVGAWIFGPVFAKARSAEAREAANTAKEVANANYNGLAALVAANTNNTNATLDRLIGTLATERAERIAGDVTLTNTVNDSVQGSQQGTLTAQQAAELSAVNSVMQQTYTDFVTGRASLNPQPVSLYSAPSPCGCPATNCGCGCNG